VGEAAAAHEFGTRRPKLRLLQRGWSAELSWRAGIVLMAPLLFVVGALLVYPFVRLISIAFQAPGLHANVKTFFDEGYNLHALRVTFVDSAIVAVVSVVLGGVVAWVVRSTPHRSLRFLLLGAVFIPFWMGSVMKLYAWTILLEREGIVNRFLIKIGVIHAPLGLIYNQFAVVVGMIYQLLPFAILPLYVVFASIDEDLLKAAHSLGASRLRVIQTIIVPLGMPGLLASATIVWVIGIGFFLTPVLLGGATSPFSASIMYSDIFQFLDFPSAVVSALMLLLSAAAVLGVVTIFVGRQQLGRTIT
jgi:ABC-type spermidine/putrescine transport system permease subunit I